MLSSGRWINMFPVFILLLIACTFCLYETENYFNRRLTSVSDMLVSEPMLPFTVKKLRTSKARSSVSTSLNQTDDIHSSNESRIITTSLIQSNNQNISMPTLQAEYATISKNNEKIKQTLSRSTTQTKFLEGPTKLFYMYDLDEEFWWRWPVDGSDCSGNGYVGHEHKENSGMGPLILPDDGLYLTWHFSLFSSLHNRMKRSSRRTLDPEKASLFIIPYDLGLDGYLNTQTCDNRRQCSHGLVGKLTSIIGKSPYFHRHQGADHVLLWSLGQYHPWPRAGCDVFMKDFCSKCTITCYWMDATKPDSRFVSLPFPSGYHWWDGIKHLPWDLSLSSQRNITAIYIGSTQTLNPTHTKIRRAMTIQCNQSTECSWYQIGHNSKDVNIAEFLSLYKRSKFCLCPPGDDPARKAVFDSIISGCIPVIFELNTLYNQYPWHITEQEALDISVYIPGGVVRSGKLDFMSVLLSISPEVIKKKQEVLAVIAPRVQYAMPPPEALADKYENKTWDPPFKDGVELALDGMFNRADAVIHNRSTNIPPKLLSGKEWGREYDKVRVQVPNITEDRVAVQQELDRMIRQGMKSGAAGVGSSAGGARGGHHGLGRSGGHGVGHGHGKHRIAGVGAGGLGSLGSGKEGEGKLTGGEEGRVRHGKHAGVGGYGVHKGPRSLPSMKAPGEDENEAAT